MVRSLEPVVVGEIRVGQVHGVGGVLAFVLHRPEARTALAETEQTAAKNTSGTRKKATPAPVWRVMSSAGTDEPVRTNWPRLAIQMRITGFNPRQ